MTALSATPRRPAPLRTVLSVVLPALLLGVLAADGWRLQVGLVTALSGLQALWAVLPFTLGWRLAADRVRTGALLGLAAGFTAIAGYYVWEWLAYDLHAATAQLTKSGGVFWVVGASLGGAVFGALGAVAGGTDADRRGLAGAATLLTAAVPAAEALLVLRLAGSGWAPDHEAVELTLLVLLAAGLGVLAWTRAPGRLFVRAALLVLPVALLCLGAFWFAESHFAYLTL